ncbi:cytochrome ubiquinol oxidase subunit I [Halococcus sp. IIIV-5B]|uniref:cytochrome ubiquinol oxidase subunit I n=1 Tax=Halococcus sp. IIIV-5B TaxID=2321230 RepID=UPI000E72FCA2|nr:cytochrome ubiquinol oxidase subunit I [Halococcus sp. IIIV-5B]RJT06196.1 cytochrome ubiquinol oxidase subunit I [Halococcus sp. IIIV-5B]
MVDPVVLSRAQFALTVIVHIVFPVLSMGLAPFLVYFTWKEIRTHEPVYEQLRRFWARIFAISFVTGTVTGIVLEFEFGTNWSEFSRAAGAVIAGPLATEGMMAFFLEAVFLGVFLFGRDRVSDRTYFASAFLTGLGSWLSATWILIVNSWMQHPRGYQLVTRNGETVITLTDPIAAYANPRFFWEFVHMQNSAVLSVALLIAGISAYYVWSGRATAFWERSLKSALAVMVVSAPFQVIHGDAYARHIANTQPEKFAAMEAVWETARYVPEYIIAFPTTLSQIFDPRAKELVGIGIPGMASWLASGGNPNAPITGLSEFANVGTPPIAVVFWSFRIMVALGFWFIVLAFWGGYRWRTGELFEDRLLHKALMASSVLGFIAVEFGWMVAEIGRQPWIIQGVMRTSEAVSPGLSGSDALLTFAGFAVGYFGLLVLVVYVLVRLVRRGPPAIQDGPDRHPGDQGVSTDD